MDLRDVVHLLLGRRCCDLHPPRLRHGRRRAVPVLSAGDGTQWRLPAQSVNHTPATASPTGRCPHERESRIPSALSRRMRIENRCSLHCRERRRNVRTALPNTRAVLERNACGTPLSTYVVVASTCCHRRSLLIATGNLREFRERCQQEPNNFLFTKTIFNLIN